MLFKLLFFFFTSCAGNDLARVLRWGTGYSGEDPYSVLLSLDEAEEVEMDRWTILLDAQEMTEDGKENGFLEPPKVGAAMNLPSDPESH